MKINLNNIIQFCVGLALSAALSFATVACTSASSSAITSTVSPITTSTVITTPSATSSPTTTQRRTPSTTPNPGTSTASATTYHIGIYSDATCTNSISSLDWGNLSQGTSETQTMYIENLDNQTMTVTASIPASANTADVTFTNSGPLNMIPGSLGPSVYQLQMSLAASSTANPGNLNFSINLTGTIPVNITSHVNIVPPPTTSAAGINLTTTSTTSNIGIYSDAACTNPISSLNWGNLPQGTSATQNVYLENLNNQTMTVTASISSNTTTGITFTNSGPLNMIPGSSGPSVYQLQMTLSASSSAKIGIINFNISLAGATPLSITNQVNIVSPSTAPSTITPALTLSSIAVTPAYPILGGVGSTQQFTATGTYSDGSNVNITSQVTWASDTPGTATISSAGLATGIATGTANITATLSGVTSTPVILTVITPTLSSITIMPASPAILATGAATGTANITAALSGVTSTPVILIVIAPASTTTST